MEASGTTPENTGQDPAAPGGSAFDPAAPGGSSPTGTGTGGSVDPDASGVPDEPEREAVEGPADELPDEDERNPARDQAPVASDRNEAIVGEQGYEQVPRQSEGNPSHVDTPVASSAPPPSLQSGVPLPEDRAAGVEPGPKGPAVPVEDAAGELPEHDASEGQTGTPPHGG